MSPPPRRIPLVLALGACLAAGALSAGRLRGLSPPSLGFENPTLRELMESSDGWTHGIVAERRVRAIDPGDGAPLYLTTLVVSGTRMDLGTGLAEEHSVEVVYPGGFLDAQHGSFNSIAPARHAARKGRRVVVFHRHEPNAYGGGPADVLVSGKGGLFTAFRSGTDDGQGGVIVQGRADRVALPHNRRLRDFSATVASLRAEGRPR